MHLRGMGFQLLRLLMIAGICSILLMTVLYTSAGVLVQQYFSGSDLEKQMEAKRIENLKTYIASGNVSATDSQKLLAWCNGQPMVLMEVYRGNILLFNSNYQYEDPLSEQNIEVNYYTWYSYYTIDFADGTAELLIYSDESYLLRTVLTVAELFLSGITFFVVALLGIRKTVQYIYQLCDEVAFMGSGDMEHPVTVKGNNELALLAQGLDQMRTALLNHQKEEAALIRRNQEMITGLSHDLRTPLTKMMLYAQIIQHGKFEDEQQLQSYLKKIYEKGLQMKEISEHLLTYSLEQRSTQPPRLQIMDFRLCFYDLLSEMVDYLDQIGFQVTCDLEWPQVRVVVIDFYLRRILDNIASNLKKYADNTEPVSIHPIQHGNFVGFCFRNKKKANSGAAGTQVGLKNLETMMCQISGRSEVTTTDTHFEIRLLFCIMQEQSEITETKG